MMDALGTLYGPIAALAVTLATIWYLGTGRFGRAQTQAWIDRARACPRLFAILDRHHGKFRAAGHYVEFGGLFLVLYWLVGTARETGMRWNPPAAAIIGAVCIVAAYLDEKHQLMSGTRQFRREDFLHSICGITGAAAVVFYADWLRSL